jgi:hypothetical protein
VRGRTGATQTPLLKQYPTGATETALYLRSASLIAARKLAVAAANTGSFSRLRPTLGPAIDPEWPGPARSASTIGATPWTRPYSAANRSSLSQCAMAFPTTRLAATASTCSSSLPRRLPRPSSRIWLTAQHCWLRSGAFADAERLQVESERRRDVRSALRAIHERLAVVELEAKLSGQIDTAPKSLTVNVQAISPEEGIEYARDVLEFFGAGAGAGASTRGELPAAVIEAEPEMTITGGCDGN